MVLITVTSTTLVSVPTSKYSDVSHAQKYPSFCADVLLTNTYVITWQIHGHGSWHAHSKIACLLLFGKEFNKYVSVTWLGIERKTDRPHATYLIRSPMLHLQVYGPIRQGAWHAAVTVSYISCFMDWSGRSDIERPWPFYSSSVNNRYNLW